MVVRDDLMVTDSGHVWQKGMSKLQHLGLSLLDSFLQDVQLGEALLLRYSQHSRVASIYGVLWSSGEILRLGGEDREGTRGH
jgi:hypothetical protein